MKPLIKPDELARLLDHNVPIVLIDARAGLDAKEKYLTSHLKSAAFVHLENDLSNIGNPKNGGRHPLPDTSVFGKTLGRLGIDTDSHVVVYDDKNASNAAARFWWMVRASGHTKVQVIDGGFEMAVKAGIPTAAGDEIPAAKAPYVVEEWQLPTVNMDRVKKAANDDEFIVIDVRDAVRYRGIKEPFDLIAGHIPGAINVPYIDNLDTAGRFLPPQDLRDKYTTLIGNCRTENIIIHCGSGVTACHTILAMEHAGMEIPSLYVGSWSEWSRNDLPIATMNLR